jgi:hypothetical protein
MQHKNRANPKKRPISGQATVCVRGDKGRLSVLPKPAAPLCGGRPVADHTTDWLQEENADLQKEGLQIARRILGLERGTFDPWCNCGNVIADKAKILLAAIRLGAALDQRVEHGPPPFMQIFSASGKRSFLQ